MSMTARRKAPAMARVYEDVKRDLLDGAIRPGERIPDAEICARLGVSRTPVREALLSLEREGLVRIVPRQGYFAAEISATDILDAYDVRFVIEPIVAAMAATKITDAELEEVRALAQISADESDAGLARAIELNKEFHLRIAQISGNARMVRMMSEVLDVLGRLALVDLRQYRSVESWSAEHLGIVDALAAHDPAAAAEAVRASFDHDAGLLPRGSHANLAQLLSAVHPSQGNSRPSRRHATSPRDAPRR
jgi:GntR family transcriptional regulator, rspAB operon transcriptional repressor